MMKPLHNLKTLATNHKVTWHHVQEKGDLKCINAKPKRSVGNFVLQCPLLTASACSFTKCTQHVTCLKTDQILNTVSQKYMLQW